MGLGLTVRYSALLAMGLGLTVRYSALPSYGVERLPTHLLPLLCREGLRQKPRSESKDDHTDRDADDKHGTVPRCLCDGTACHGTGHHGESEGR